MFFTPNKQHSIEKNLEIAQSLTQPKQKVKEKISTTNRTVNQDNINNINNINDNLIINEKKKFLNDNNKLAEHKQKYLLNNEQFNQLLSQLNLDFDPNISEEKKKLHIELFKLGLLPIYKYQLNNIRQTAQFELDNIVGKKKTLILDLDDTLIYTSQRGNEKDYQYCYRQERFQILFNIRPFTYEFLKQMSKFYEIIVFTTGEQRYAQAMCTILDPEKQYISYVLDEKYPITQRDGFMLKDIEVIKNRDLKDLVIVDNYIQSFAFHIENGIPILMWKDDQNDQELKYLAEFLESIAEEDDLRIPLQKKLGTAEIIKLVKNCMEVD